MILPFSLTRKLAIASLLCASALPCAAYAGDQADAEAAIAVAKGKLAAGDKVGTNLRAPELQEQARAALLEAQDLLNNHHKKEARDAAMRAGEMADRAMVAGENRRASMEQTRRLDSQQATINAQQSAANANMRADSAQAMGNAANARADTAERDAANVRADAARAEAARPMIMPAPAPAQTTTTVIQRESETSSAPVAARKPVRKARKLVHRHITRGKVTTTTVHTVQQ
jgi:hypothetical protein